MPLARKISNHTSNNQATAMEETMRKRKSKGGRRGSNWTKNDDECLKYFLCAIV